MTTTMHSRHHRATRGGILAAAAAAALLAAPREAHAAPAASTYAPGALLNEGNRHFRAGRPGRAVLAYERGLLLAPRDPDLRTNLDRARAELALPPPPGGAAEAVARHLSPREWVTLGAAALFALCTSLVLGTVLPRRRRLFSTASLTFALVGSVASAGLWLTTRIERRAVVVADRAVARVSPFASADTLFTVSEGRTVEVLAQHEEHLRVQDGHGRAGWVSQREVTPVVP